MARVPARCTSCHHTSRKIYGVDTAPCPAPCSLSSPLHCRWCQRRRRRHCPHHDPPAPPLFLLGCQWQCNRCCLQSGRLTAGGGGSRCCGQSVEPRHWEMHSDAAGQSRSHFAQCGFQVRGVGTDFWPCASQAVQLFPSHPVLFDAVLTALHWQPAALTVSSGCGTCPLQQQHRGLPGNCPSRHPPGRPQQPHSSYFPAC